MGIQPAYPFPVPLSEIEQAYIDESPAGLFPQNQDSNFGFHRKILCDQLTKVLNQLTLLSSERWPNTSTVYLNYHEYAIGLPTDTAQTIAYRQALIMIRYLRGPFTVPLVETIVTLFINATLGVPLSFGTMGISLGSGVPLFAPSAPVTNLYKIIQNVSGFSYSVLIDESVGVDFVALERELLRVTPSGISFTIATMYQVPGGAKTKLKAGGAEAHH